MQWGNGNKKVVVTVIPIRYAMGTAGTYQLYVCTKPYMTLLFAGMPTYGRTFTLSNPNNFKVNSPASGGGKAGEYTKEGGFLAYYEVIIIKNIAPSIKVIYTDVFMTMKWRRSYTGNFAVIYLGKIRFMKVSNFE